MASLQHRNGSWRVLFRFKGQLTSYSIGKVDEAEAHATKGKVEYLLLRIKQNLMTVPAGIASVPEDLRIDVDVLDVERDVLLGFPLDRFIQLVLRHFGEADFLDDDRVAANTDGDLLGPDPIL